MCLDTSGMHLQSRWAAVLTKVEQYSTSNPVMQQIEIQDRTIFNIFTEVLPLLSRLYLYSDIPPIFEWVSHKMSWMLLQLYVGYISHKKFVLTQEVDLAHQTISLIRECGLGMTLAFWCRWIVAIYIYIYIYMYIHTYVQETFDTDLIFPIPDSAGCINFILIIEVAFNFRGF